MEKNRVIGAAALVIGMILIAAVLAHAWKLMKTPEEKTASNSIRSEASDDIWIDETQLETNKDVTLSLKEAVLGNAQQEKQLVVFTQNVSDIIKITDKGALPFNLSKKHQYVKYSGTATYTVDLSGIDENHLRIDEDSKTLTIFIPHTVQKLDINEDETQADDTENVGIFSIGDLKQSEEERAEVIAEVKKNMEKKLADDKVIDIADRMAKLSVWEIYQPVVTKVDPAYTVAVEFT